MWSPQFWGHIATTCEGDIPGTEDGVCCTWQCTKAKEAQRKLEKTDFVCFKALLSEWSDGFDPNGKTKDNRGSVHITSFTLYSEKEQNSQHLSFPVIATPDKSDKNKTRTLVYDDIKQLE